MRPSLGNVVVMNNISAFIINASYYRLSILYEYTINVDEHESRFLCAYDTKFANIPTHLISQRVSCVAE